MRLKISWGMRNEEKLDLRGKRTVRNENEEEGEEEDCGRIGLYVIERPCRARGFLNLNKTRQRHASALLSQHVSIWTEIVSGVSVTNQYFQRATRSRAGQQASLHLSALSRFDLS